jgi:hypothetical protein
MKEVRKREHLERLDKYSLNSDRYLLAYSRIFIDLDGIGIFLSLGWQKALRSFAYFARRFAPFFSATIDSEFLIALIARPLVRSE